jgi:homoserine dehydrogenase
MAVLGFGTVNQALHALLARRREALARDHGVACIVTGVASRRLGWRASSVVMHYEADVFPGGLTVTSRDPDPTTTAYECWQT